MTYAPPGTSSCQRKKQVFEQIGDSRCEMQKRYLKGMLRPACIDSPGVLHHIGIRGIEQRGIFEENKDLEDFLERLSRQFQETVTPSAWECKKGRHK